MSEMKTKIGNCGWGFFRPREYFGADWKKTYPSRLSAYAARFNLIEVNSTFYHIPKTSTAGRWLAEAREVNENFEFTLKCTQLVTHKDSFAGSSVHAFEQMKKICKALDARILLFQSPASFSPDKKNINAMRGFFRKINRGKLVLAWEPRGEWWEEEGLAREVCEELNLITCVDPLRNEPQHFGNSSIAYFRLHGFGKPSMYFYKFSDAELELLKAKMKKLKTKECYMLFNNAHMYEDALRLEKLLRG